MSYRYRIRKFVTALGKPSTWFNVLSVLGFIWWFILPLLGLFIWWIVVKGFATVLLTILIVIIGLAAGTGLVIVCGKISEFLCSYFLDKAFDYEQQGR